MPFADPTDIAALLRRQMTSDELAAATIALELASSAVRAYCRQEIDLIIDDTALIVGTWDRRLRLPERPVLTVTAVAVDGDTLSSDDYTVVRDRLIRPDGCHWGGPDVIVTVTYSHGWATPPGEVRAVAMSVALRLITNPEFLANERSGQYGATFAGERGVELSLAEQHLLDGRMRRRTAPN